MNEKITQILTCPIILSEMYSKFLFFATGESIARMMPNANLALATPALEENWGPPVINNLIANTFDEGMQTVFHKFLQKWFAMIAMYKIYVYGMPSSLGRTCVDWFHM